MLNAISRELRARRLINPRQPYVRGGEPYLGPRLRWP